MARECYFYKLDEQKRPVPATLEEGTKLLENFEQRIVARTEIGKVIVSTIFLVIDHEIFSGQPVLFETCIFEAPEGQSQLEP